MMTLKRTCAHAQNGRFVVLFSAKYFFNHRDYNESDRLLLFTKDLRGAFK